MRTVSTENSTYEIDESNKLIRRVHGVNDPTQRQGEDGEWKEYLGIMFTGGGILIQWGWNGDSSAKCTLTSNIVSNNEG